MKNNRPPCRLPLLLLLASFAFAFAASAQIQVGLSGVTNDFTSQPPASQWATRSVSGNSSAPNGAAAVDAQAQANTAGAVTLQPASAAGSPPTETALAVWSSAGFLQTRPSGNALTFLMATLRNNSGVTLGQLNISYDLTTLLAMTEETPGHRVYFSLTGNANSWQTVTNLSGDGTSGPKSAALNLGQWTNTAVLYILWADDNGSGSPDTVCQIDNFKAAPSTAPAGVAVPPQNQSVAPGHPITFSVIATGAPPIFYQWRKDEAGIGAATNSSFAIANAQAADAGAYSVLVSNAFGTATSAVAVLTVACTDAAVITVPPANQYLPHGATLQLSVTASGTAPLRYQWQRDGVPLANATNQNYTKAGATPDDSGGYFVIVTNCAGAATSSTARVAVAASPFTLLGLTNVFWKYDQSGLDPGAAWKETAFDDTAWPSGRGLLARETDNALVQSLTNTVLSLVNPGGSNTLSYYFRAHFTVTNDPNALRLVVSNIFDDGAVFYLNGTECKRVNMPEGAVSFLTTASGASTEGVFTNFSLPTSLVVTGDNVLAVEVHQVSSGSSDIVFGLALINEFLPPSPPVFSPQPADTGAFLGGSAGFFPDVVSLETARLQWFHAGLPLLDETNKTLLRTNLSLTHAGLYALVASNSYGAVTSRTAYLSVAVVPERLRLIEFTNQWRYNLSGSVPGNWRNPGFDDSAWDLGRGVLLHTTLSGFPEATNTTLPLTNSSGPIANYYFRATFSRPPGVSNLFLVASNLIDDAAIFYLNGNEMGRFRIQTSGNTTTTFSAPGNGRTYDVFTFNASDLLAAGNVVAVQVIQIQPTSSDIVFGMNLFGYAAAPHAPQFIVPPASQTVLEGDPAVFAPQVFGAVPMQHQWLRNGVAVNGATNLLLTLPAAHPSLAGNYQLLASNAYGVATRAVATLIVPADVLAPFLVDATLTNGASAVLVTFSEPVSASTATNLAHYTLAPGVTLLSAQLIAPNQVLLLASGLDVQFDYTLTVSGILDRADAPNQIIAGSSIRLRPNRVPLPTGLLNVETVFVILMQNYPWSQVKNHPDCPFINSLLPRVAWSENYHSPNNQHPSTPNTLWLEAGEAFGVEDNRGPDIWRAPTTNHLANQLRLAGIEWRAYAEGLPPDGSGTNIVSGSYYPRQNPFTFFDDVTGDLGFFTNHVRTFDQFSGDLSTNGIGRYNFIVPSLTNSMDFLPPGVSTRQQAGDNFLAALVPQILASPSWSNQGALFIVWDEDALTLTEPIGLMLLSPHARPGHASTTYADHSSLLRTLQEIFRVGPLLGAAANAQPLNDLFKDLSLRVATSNGVAGVWLENVRPGRTNYVQASADLNQWTTIQTNTATNRVFIADPAPAGPQRFYRAVEAP